MFRKLPKFVDKRNSLPKHKTKRYGRRSLSAIKYIAIHHSATTGGSAETFAKSHINKDWPGIGYHFVIEKNGTIVWCNDLETISYHVGGHNTPSVGICMIGNFTKESPTQAQLESTYALVKTLMEMLNISTSNVKGHKEFPNQSTACPGLSMNNFRKELGKTKVNTRSVKEASKTSTPNKIFKLTSPYMRDRAGESYIKDIQKALGVTADGIFGPKTEQAVKDFQKKNGLTVDGIVGPKTWEALFNKSSKPTDKPKNVPKYPGRVFKLTSPYMRDAKGETYIKDIQKAVGLKGSDVDGIYGPKTEQYVKNFQKKRGITVDGIAGPKTWEALFG